MKFILWDSNDNRVATTESLTLGEAKQVFEKVLKRSYDWQSVTPPDPYYDVVITDEKDRHKFFKLTLLSGLGEPTPPSTPHKLGFSLPAPEQP